MSTRETAWTTPKGPIQMMNTVIEMNNRGVQYLGTGHHHQARTCFKDALVESNKICHLFLLEKSTQHHPPTNPCTHNKSTESSKSLLDLSYQLFIDTVPIKPNAKQNKDSSVRLSSNDGSGLHEVLALTLSSNMTPVPFEKKDSSLLTDNTDTTFGWKETIVVTFNLALVHHWRGICLCNPRLLPKALELYKMTLSLLADSPLQSRSFFTLFMALGKNMGHVHLARIQAQQL